MRCFLFFVILVLVSVAVKAQQYTTSTKVEFQKISGYPLPVLPHPQQFNVPNPGGRVGSGSCSGIFGELYLYGGAVYDPIIGTISTKSLGADFWVWNSVWTWKGGFINSEPTNTTHPGARFNPKLWLSGGRIYLFGGTTINGDAKVDLWVFDFDINNWKLSPYPRTKFPEALKHPSIATSDNNLWLYGGEFYNSTSKTRQISSLLWKFDLTTLEWDSVDLGFPGTIHGQLWVASKVYCHGGFLASGVLNSLSITYDYNNNSIYTVDKNSTKYDTIDNCSLPPYPCLPGPRAGAATWSIENQLFLYGGGKILDNQTVFPYFNDLWVYTEGKGWVHESGFAGDATTALDPIPIPASLPAVFPQNNAQKYFGGRTNFDSEQNMTTDTKIYYKDATRLVVSEEYNIQTIYPNYTGDHPGSLREAFLFSNLTLAGGLGVVKSESIVSSKYISGEWQTQTSFNATGLQGYALWYAENRTFIFGGYRPVGAQKEYYNELWDSKGVRLIQLINVPDPREGALTWTFLGELYLYGGKKGAQTYDDMWRYSIAKNEWNMAFTGGPLLSYASVTTDGGSTVWIYNGSTLFQYNMFTVAFSTQFHAEGLGTYPLDYNMGSPLTEYPPPRSNAAIAYAGGNIYIFGGDSGTGVYNDLWEYNITAKTWFWLSGDSSTIALGYKNINYESRYPLARSNHAFATVSKGLMYFYGGYGNVIDSNSEMIQVTYSDLWRLQIVSSTDVPVCGNGVLERGEQCEPYEGSERRFCCTLLCTFSTEICRYKQGDCDEPDYCTGTSLDCEDKFSISSVLCNATLCQFAGGTAY